MAWDVRVSERGWQVCYWEDRGARSTIFTRRRSGSGGGISLAAAAAAAAAAVAVARFSLRT